MLAELDAIPVVSGTEERRIPYQREVLFNGATDAWSMSRAVDLISAFAEEFKEPL